MKAPDAAAGQSPSLLTAGEMASCAALVGEVARGSMLATRPVWQADVGNRVLDAVCAQLRAQSFLAVVIEGGSDDFVRKAWSLIAAARVSASRELALGPTVLIVKDAHLLKPTQLDALAQAGDVAIVAAPVVPSTVRRRERLLSRLRIADIGAAPVLAALAIGAFWFAADHFSWDLGFTEPVIGRGPELRASTVSQDLNVSTAVPSSNVPKPVTEPAPPGARGAPGLLLVAKSGDTLESLYQRVYRGATPPPFASIAALNPEPVRPGAILTFPEPESGWATSSGAAEQGPVNTKAPD